jgi:hypothetical protein
VGTYGGDPSRGRCRVECFQHCCCHYSALHEESGGDSATTVLSKLSPGECLPSRRGSAWAWRRSGSYSCQGKFSFCKPCRVVLLCCYCIQLWNAWRLDLVYQSLVINFDNGDSTLCLDCFHNSFVYSSWRTKSACANGNLQLIRSWKSIYCSGCG